MGADLYIHDIYDAEKARFQPFWNLSIKLRNAITDHNRNPVAFDSSFKLYELQGDCRAVKQFLVDHPEYLKEYPQKDWHWKRKIESMEKLLNTLYDKFCDEDRKEVSPTKKQAETFTNNAQEFIEFFDYKMHENGYFRDSYNVTSVFWRLGLSWWQDVCGGVGEEKDPEKSFVNDEGEIAGEKLVEFYHLIEGKELDLPSDKQWFKDNHASLDGENPIEEWNKFWIEKKEEFLKFIQTAIDNKAAIYASC